MKPRLVLWGTDAQDARVLIALELRPKDNKVNVYTFPEHVVTEEFNQKMMDEWRDGALLDFPEGYLITERELTVSDSLLPDDLKVERADVVHRAQSEWHFMVLSSKLNESYNAELTELKDRVEKLESYDNSLWDELKGFWDKVQAQVRDRNLFREHANNLRDATNALFSKMKEMRHKLDEEFDTISKKNFDNFLEKIGNVEKKIVEGFRLQPLFDELKDLQRTFRESKLSREHRATVWEKLDNAFKTVKEKRFPGSSDDKSPVDRIKRRYEGLLAAIEKMERSIKRDRDDLDFQNRKIENTDGQLEAQIRQAKIKMINERIGSKEEKLNEMLATKQDLEQRINQIRSKESEKEKREEAKKAAQDKIAQEMKAREEALKEDADKLTKAAEAIVGEKGKDAAESSEVEADKPSLFEQISDQIEDAVDTVKAVVEVVEERIEEAVEELFDQDDTAEEDDAPASATEMTEPSKAEEEEKKED